MNITIINGSSKDGLKDFQETITKLVDQLQGEHQVDVFTVADMKLYYCQGCWDCWTKTPGVCRIKDDGVLYLKSLAKADLLVVLSPVKAGFISKEAKKALDRFIPTALPHIGIYQGECHHFNRYPAERKRGIYLLDDGAIDEEAEDIIFENFSRIKMNFRTDTLLKGRLNTENYSEVVHEISHC